MAFVFVAGIKVELCCYLFEEKEDCRQSGDLCEFEKVILNFNGLRLRWDFIHVMVPTLAQKYLNLLLTLPGKFKVFYLYRILSNV